MLHPGLAHVRDVMQSSPLIRRHIEKRERELALFDLVLSRLPKALRNHCRDACLAEGVLTLFLDSPAWLTRARFAIDDLAQALRSKGVEKVVTQVRIESAGPARPTPRGHQGEPESGRTVSHRLSDQTIAHLVEAADAMTDPALANQFRRLAQQHARLAGPARSRLGGAGETPGRSSA